MLRSREAVYKVAAGKQLHISWAPRQRNVTVGCEIVVKILKIVMADESVHEILRTPYNQIFEKAVMVRWLSHKPQRSNTSEGKLNFFYTCDLERTARQL